jgi:hypothetical protein
LPTGAATEIRYLKSHMSIVKKIPKNWLGIAITRSVEIKKNNDKNKVKIKSKSKLRE